MKLGIESREDWGCEVGNVFKSKVKEQRHIGNEKGPQVMVAGESFPVFGLRSVTSLFNVGLRRDRVFLISLKK